MTRFPTALALCLVAGGASAQEMCSDNVHGCWPARSDHICYAEDTGTPFKTVLTPSATTFCMIIPNQGPLSISSSVATHCPEGYELVLRQDMRPACARDVRDARGNGR